MSNVVSTWLRFIVVRAVRKRYRCNASLLLYRADCEDDDKNQVSQGAPYPGKVPEVACRRLKSF